MITADSTGTLIQRRLAALPQGMASLLRRLRTYDVVWQFPFVPTENEEYEVGIDREAVDLDQANVVSSEIKQPPLLEEIYGRTHVVAIDLDIPAYLIPSTTPGHGHLYIDVPGGIRHEDYMELLDVLAKCKIIEPGYADVSKKRGHTDLRLPWVKKWDQKVLTIEEFDRAEHVVKARGDAKDLDLIEEPF